MGRAFKHPTVSGCKLKDENYNGRLSQTKLLYQKFRDIDAAIGKNMVRSIDKMTYANDAAVQAEWVASDAAATSGVAATRNTSNQIEGSSQVLFTTGTGSFSSDVTVTKSLTRDTGNYFEDYYAKAGCINLEPYNYIGFGIYTGAATAAGDLDIILTDIDGNTLTQDIPAIDSNHATVNYTVDLKLSDFSGSGKLKNIASVAFKFNSSMGTSETVNIDDIIAYKYSNGFGPAFGDLIPVELNEDSVVRGMIAKHSEDGLVPKAVSANDGDEEAYGIFCGSGDTGDIVLVQVNGLALQECASLTSLERGDSLSPGANSGYTVSQSAATQADAFAKFHSPFPSGDSPAQYHLIRVQLGHSGATPS